MSVGTYVSLVKNIHKNDFKNIAISWIYNLLLILYLRVILNINTLF